MVFLPIRMMLSGRRACWSGGSGKGGVSSRAGATAASERHAACCLLRLVVPHHHSYCCCCQCSAVMWSRSSSIQAGTQTHRTDVGHLLGAHIVCVHDERLVIGVQVVTQAVVVLWHRRQQTQRAGPAAAVAAARKPSAAAAGCVWCCAVAVHPSCQPPRIGDGLCQNNSRKTHRLLLLELGCGWHLGCLLAGPNRVNDRQATLTCSCARRGRCWWHAHVLFPLAPAN